MAANGNISRLTTEKDYSIDNAALQSRVATVEGLIKNERRLRLEMEEEDLQNQLQSLDKIYKHRLKLAQDQHRKEKKLQAEIDKLKKESITKNAKEIEKLEKALKAEKKTVEELAEAATKLAEAEERMERVNKLSSSISSKDFKSVSGMLRGSDLNIGEKISGLISGIANFSKILDNQIDEIAGYQSKINTRLIGSGKRYDGVFGLNQKLTGVVSTSPYLKTADVMSNLSTLVQTGISYNVEQRAFLQTLKENIADTFDALDTTLLNLIRVQQGDTTAARLGMESRLTTYFNTMYQDTEYLNSLSDAVSSAIYEATAQMGAKAGVGFEYQVQKWLGSLYSVGMSSQGIQSIANAIGMLGSGDVSGLASNSSLQNLLVMSSSRAGMSYSELLANGLDESSTNKLLRSMVDYLAEIADSNNKVVTSQLGKVFGMSMSDLKAVTNIANTDLISSETLNYSGAMAYLNLMANTMATRMSVGQMMQNTWDNATYGISSGIASNPALYALWKASGMLEDVVGGGNLPFVEFAAEGVDLNASIADLMRVGALSGGILGSIGTAISGLASGGGLIGSGMLSALGINGGITSITRGSGMGVNGMTTSASSFIGNSSGSDIYNTSLASAEDSKKQALAEAKEGNEDTKSVKDVYELLAASDGISGYLKTISEILSDVVIGSRSLQVKYDSVSGGF